MPPAGRTRGTRTGPRSGNKSQRQAAPSSFRQSASPAWCRKRPRRREPVASLGMQQSSTIAEPRGYADGKMLANRRDGVGVVTFNQPEKRNAISVEMWNGLGEILDAFKEDEQ